jgi:hypothetical protein
MSKAVRRTTIPLDTALPPYGGLYIAGQISTGKIPQLRAGA